LGGGQDKQCLTCNGFENSPGQERGNIIRAARELDAANVKAEEAHCRWTADRRNPRLLLKVVRSLRRYGRLKEDLTALILKGGLP
jgi:hypothetical protein